MAARIASFALSGGALIVTCESRRLPPQPHWFWKTFGENSRLIPSPAARILKAMILLWKKFGTYAGERLVFAPTKLTWIALITKSFSTSVIPVFRHSFHFT